MLTKKLDFNAPFVVRWLVILIALVFTVFTYYEWNALGSELGDQILTQHYDLSTSISTKIEADVDPEKYREVFSVSTADKKYFLIDFINWQSINPNIIPHPTLKNTWVIVAQRHNLGLPDQTIFIELVCNATFQKGVLRCLDSPVDLPIASTFGDKCIGDLTWFTLSKGPHDGRVFYGPQSPYTVFGSNSMFTCFGQVVQDFRSLMDWGETSSPDTGFENATEIQRPPPYGTIEKNWFLFWDHNGQIYAHYDVSPKRVFAKLEIDGSVGEDLAPRAAVKGDDKCMEKYMPHVGPDHESIHQATNSLSVTLCKRSDPTCKPTDLNTFIFTIFQTKIYHSFHSTYEPYVMLFEQKAPFKVHGISTKPFWIHGRGKPNEVKMQNELVRQGVQNAKEEVKIWYWNQTEMMYITSLSWKSHAQKYHGYIDDVVFLAFGIEDFQSAGIDVVVGDLLLDIGYCLSS